MDAKLEAVDWPTFEQAGVWTLGPVELRDAQGASVPVGGPIARMLLVVLADADGRSVADDRLIDAVWEEAPNTVGASLRVHISAVRSAVRALNVDLVRRHSGYAFDPPLPIVDARAIERVGPTANEAAHETSPEESLSKIEHALALWRGPALADVRRLPFGWSLAATLDERRQALEDRRDELLIRCGRGREALPRLRGVVRDDPLNEQRWANLAAALHDAGRTAEALRVLDQARTALVDGAGLSPGRKITDLEQTLLAAGESAPTASVAPTRLPVTLEHHVVDVLHGRDGEHERIDRLVQTVRATGSSAVLRIVGEPGIGKTALAASAARRAAADGFSVVHLSADGPGVITLHRLDAHVDRRLDVYDGPAERARLVARLRSVLADVAAGGPSLLIVDDVHRIDELSAETLRRVARQPLDRPLLVLLLDREETSSIGGDVLPLHRLSAEAVDQWVAASGGCNAESLARAAGHPLFLSALLSGSNTTPEPGGQLVATILPELSPQGQDLAVIAAATGMTFTSAQLTRLAGSDPVTTVEELDAAIHAGLLRFDPLVADTYHFRHDMVRTAVLSLLSISELQRVHADIAGRGAGVLSATALLAHARAAGPRVERDTVAALTIAAVDELLVVGAAAAARDEATSTLGIDGLTDAVTAVLLCRRARCSAALGQGLDAHADIEEALSVARCAADTEALAEVFLARLWVGFPFSSDPEEPPLLHEVIRSVAPAEHQRRLSLLRVLIGHYLNAGHLDGAGDALSQARVAATAVGPAARAELASLEHWFAESSGDRRHRRAVVRSAVLRARTGGAQSRIAALGLEIVEALHAGDPSRADQLATELQQVGARAAVPNAEWLGALAQFSQPFLAGDLRAAARASDVALGIGREAGVVGARGAYATQSFALAWHTGDLETYVRPLRQVTTTGDDFAWRSALALALATTGEHEEATQLLVSSIDSVRVAGSSWLGFVGIAMAVEAAALVGADEVLAAATPQLRRRSGDHVILGWGAADYGPVDRYLAVALRHTGHTREAELLLRDVAYDHRSGAVWQERASVEYERWGKEP